MNSQLTMEERQFLNEVLSELKQYRISLKHRKEIKQQLLEHFQESREHGEDGLNELGDSTTFVRDIIEVNGVDLHSEIKDLRKSKGKPGILFVLGLSIFVVTYLGLQLILSMFLTDSFSPLNTNSSFNYNIFYQISDHLWWNFLLMFISLSSSVLVSVLVVLYLRNIKLKR